MSSEAANTAAPQSTPGPDGTEDPTAASTKGEQPHVVYFSSATENTARFVEKLGFPSSRIPLRPKDPFLNVDQDYVLLVPTYGGGTLNKAVPRQVVKFLNDPENRRHCRGVISSGNTNFGTAYCIAGDIISAKLKVPFLYRFELLGTTDDVRKVKEGLEEFWQKI